MKSFTNSTMATNVRQGWDLALKKVHRGYESVET